MADREKVIESLDECLSASCRGYRTGVFCPLGDNVWDMLRNVRALLMAPKEHPVLKDWLRVKYSVMDAAHNHAGGEGGQGVYELLMWVVGLMDQCEQAWPEEAVKRDD